MPSPVRFRALNLLSLESRDVPSAVVVSEPFDSPGTSLPASWQQWSSSPDSGFSLQAAAAQSGSGGLSSSIPFRGLARTWLSEPVSRDHLVEVSLRPGKSGPGAIFTRGTDLATTKPNAIAVYVDRGGTVSFREIIAGSTRTFTNVRAQQAAPDSTWFRVELIPDGSTFRVRVQRTDTNQYLSTQGTWQTDPAFAITRTANWNPSVGSAGLMRPGHAAGVVSFDNFKVTNPVAVQSATESFDDTPANALPAGWAAWQSNSFGTVQVSPARANGPGNGLAMAGNSQTTSRAWRTDSFDADVRATASYYAETLIPGRIIIRGQNLNTSTPTFYAAQVTRGVEVKLIRSVQGVETVLGTLRSSQYLSGVWLDVSLISQGSNLRVMVVRGDTGQWLSANGSWSNSPDTALTVQDTAIPGSGFVGVGRAALAAGTIAFDDFTVVRNAAQPISVNVTASQSLTQVQGDLHLRATASGGTAIARIDYLFGDKIAFTANDSPADWTLDTTMLANGSHILTVLATDEFGETGRTSITLQISNPNSTPPSVPTLARKLPHIRIAQLAYSGNPVGPFEQQKLQSAVDLVIPDSRLMTRIDDASPETPQLLYTNVSNLYLDLLRDWLTYADANGIDRETAFYHVAAATPWQGGSPSSVPVNQFWSVARGRADGSGVITDLTSAARGGQNFNVTFGGSGDAVAIGGLEKFREVNVDLVKPPGTGWTGVWEYSANGQWKTLAVLNDSTFALRQKGTLTFHPPADWTATSLTTTGPRVYAVRFKVLTGTTAQSPEARTILGRDYVGANGGNTGTIPAFDSQADRDADGYLNDAEYAARRKGFDARFEYESRLFYPYYGQSRYVTNPTSSAVRNWAADYHQRLLAATPLADGLFVDNSNGRLPFAGTAVLEPTATFTADAAALVEKVWKAVSPKLVFANTVGSQTEGNTVAAKLPGVVEEFLLRPTEASWSTFNTVAGLVAGRLGSADPSPYLIMDSHPGTTSASDPRTQLGTLAYYYLLADPERTFLMMFGGSSPSSPWSGEWITAAETEIGQPQGDVRLFASGADPQNLSLEYRIFARDYDDALVLYKPRSYALGKGTGTTADATATTHLLPGNYRPLNANGTLGAVVNQITLRNGEGTVLVRV